MKGEPAGPEARATTVREALRTELLSGFVTARELSGRIGLPEKEIASHLQHVARSARQRGERFLVQPAECLACGFSFSKRDRLTRPGRCPECGSERIDAPAFRIERGR